MKYGLWFLSAAGIGGIGTLLAASLPVPPSLPSTATRHVGAGPTLIAAASAPSAPAAPMTPSAPSPAPPAPPQAAVAPPARPAAPPPQAAATPRAVLSVPAVAQPKRVVAAVTAAPSQKPRRPTRHLAKATPDRHRRVVVRLIRQPPVPYPGMPVRPPTRIAMGPPPPYGMPAPYWRMPYPPDY
jgi:hypothetical protein